MYDLYNSSALSNTFFPIDNYFNSSLAYGILNSSVTILSGSFHSNQTYQFMVSMENRQNSSIKARGYLIVTITDGYSPLISIG